MPFDLPSATISGDDDHWSLETIHALTQESHETIRRRLAAEYLQIGSNVRKDFQARGLSPHQWDKRVEKFYAESEALLYEAIVWNRCFLKIWMRRRIGQILSAAGRPLRVLCFGDGCGYDSLYLSQCGHHVAYSDVPGLPARFARLLFKKKSCSIEMALEPRIPSASYDVVVCLDVLEHCPNPPQVVSDLTRWLKPGGLLLVTAPFFLVTPNFPGHLSSNIKFSGAIGALYGVNGLRVKDGSLFWDPLILAKEGGHCWMKSASTSKRCLLRLVGLLFAAARISTLPFVMLLALDQVRRWAAAALLPAGQAPRH